MARRSFEDFEGLGDTISRAMLHDVGATAAKGGYDVNAPTCWAEGSDTGIRKDFILASTSALDMIEELEVEEEGCFPTHRVVKAKCKAVDLRTSARMKAPVMEIDTLMPRDQKGRIDLAKVRR